MLVGIQGVMEGGGPPNEKDGAGLNNAVPAVEGVEAEEGRGADVPPLVIPNEKGFVVATGSGGAADPVVENGIAAAGGGGGGAVPPNENNVLATVDGVVWVFVPMLVAVQAVSSNSSDGPSSSVSVPKFSIYC